MDVIWINQFVRSDWLESFDNYISKNNFSTEVFFERIINQVNKFENKIYSLPVFLDAGLLYYRKDLLEKYNYNPPETWNELLESSFKIQENEINDNPFFSGFLWQGAQYEGLVCTFLEYISSNDGSILDKGKINLQKNENISALNFMQELIHQYKISPQNIYTEMKEEEVRRAFQRGNALYERNWAYAWSLHQQDDSPVKGKIGIKILPHFDKNNSAATMGGWHIGMSEYSDRKEEAWQFISYVTSFEAQKKMMKKIGWNPARKDIYENEELLKELPRLKVLKQALEISVARPNVPYYPQISDIIQRYVNECLAGKISAENALKEAQSEIEKITAVYEE